MMDVNVIFEGDEKGLKELQKELMRDIANSAAKKNIKIKNYSSEIYEVFKLPDGEIIKR